MTARFNLELHDDAKEIVAKLMSDTGLRTQTDVFENALALFGWAIVEAQRGRIITSLDKDTRQYGELQMPSLMAAARKALKPAAAQPTTKPKPRRKALRANDSETSTPGEFRPRGAEGSSF